MLYLGLPTPVVYLYTAVFFGWEMTSYDTVDCVGGLSSDASVEKDVQTNYRGLKIGPRAGNRSRITLRANCQSKY